jgi:hypothetical protein
MKNLNHNHYAIGLVVGVVLFLGMLVSGNQDIPISELTGQALHKLGLFAAFSFGLIYFVGGTAYDVIESIKPDPKALAILVGSLVLGAALVLGH